MTDSATATSPVTGECSAFELHGHSGVNYDIIYRMPYTDKDKQRQFQRERVRAQRAEWILANGPCVNCGCTNQLQVDHIDPTQKVTHNVWSWTATRRNAELAKCQVLCERCHIIKTNWEKRSRIKHGRDNTYTGQGCRCRPCTDAHNTAKNQYREQRRSAGLSYT